MGGKVQGKVAIKMAGHKVTNETRADHHGTSGYGGGIGYNVVYISAIMSLGARRAGMRGVRAKGQMHGRIQGIKVLCTRVRGTRVLCTDIRQKCEVSLILACSFKPVHTHFQVKTSNRYF